MSAVLKDATSPALDWQAMTVTDLDAVLAIEQQGYSHPWTRGNFIDSIAAGHWAWCGRVDGTVRAYWLAMAVLDEVHLLNVAVARDHWGQGLGEQAMSHLAACARSHGAAQIWLEVRPSNERALALYGRMGYVSVGLRRGYYPAAQSRREDACVLRLELGAAP